MLCICLLFVQKKEKMFFHYWQFYIRIKTLDMVNNSDERIFYHFCCVHFSVIFMQFLFGSDKYKIVNSNKCLFSCIWCPLSIKKQNISYSQNCSQNCYNSFLLLSHFQWYNISQMCNPHEKHVTQVILYFMCNVTISNISFLLAAIFCLPYLMIYFKITEGCKMN